MKVTSFKTHKLSPNNDDIYNVLEKYLPKIGEQSVVVVTSKIVSICENRVVKIGEIDKEELVRKEAELYLPAEENQYNIMIAIKRNLIVPTAGIDESNGNGYYILWPKDPQKSANEIRSFLKKIYSLKHIGVIITDSKTTPLRWGTNGVSIAHSGFSALNDYIGKPDIFGRLLQHTKSNIADALACASVVVMGEGKEQTPLAMIEDLPFVNFQDRNPTKTEIKDLHISLGDDVYSSLLKGANWRKGESLEDN